MAQLDALLKKQHANTEARSRLLAEARELQASIDALSAKDAAKARVASLSDAERAALAQVLQAEGITSGEAVGNLGG